MVNLIFILILDRANEQAATDRNIHRNGGLQYWSHFGFKRANRQLSR